MKRSFYVVGTALVGLVLGIMPVLAQRTPMIVRDIPIGPGTILSEQP